MEDALFQEAHEFIGIIIYEFYSSEINAGFLSIPVADRGSKWIAFRKVSSVYQVISCHSAIYTLFRCNGHQVTGKLEGKSFLDVTQRRSPSGFVVIDNGHVIVCGQGIYPVYITPYPGFAERDWIIHVISKPVFECCYPFLAQISFLKAEDLGKQALSFGKSTFRRNRWRVQAFHNSALLGFKKIQSLQVG